MHIICNTPAPVAWVGGAQTAGRLVSLLLLYRSWHHIKRLFLPYPSHTLFQKIYFFFGDSCIYCGIFFPHIPFCGLPSPNADRSDFSLCILLSFCFFLFLILINGAWRLTVLIAADLPGIYTVHILTYICPFKSPVQNALANDSSATATADFHFFFQIIKP